MIKKLMDSLPLMVFGIGLGAYYEYKQERPCPISTISKIRPFKCKITMEVYTGSLAYISLSKAGWCESGIHGRAELPIGLFAEHQSEGNEAIIYLFENQGEYIKIPQK